MIASLAAAFAILALQAAPAAEPSPPDTFGLMIGSEAPAFTAETHQGLLAGYEDLAGPNGLVLYFHRSLDWCPNCVAQAMDVNANAEAFLERGYGVAFVSMDTPETLRLAAERRGLDAVTLIADAESELIDQFEVRDPRYADPSSRAHGVAYPVAFVLDESGMVSAKVFEGGGLIRADGHETPVDTLRVLDNLDTALAEN